MDDILTENLITNAEAQEILKGRKKEIELGYDQKNSLDYLKKYSELTGKKAEKMKEDLGKISKLRERQIISIINIMPEDRDDLRLILEKTYTNLEDDEKKLILETVKNNK
jgi:DNA-directed RNA polymerase subunit F